MYIVLLVALALSALISGFLLLCAGIQAYEAHRAISQSGNPSQRNYRNVLKVLVILSSISVIATFILGKATLDFSLPQSSNSLTPQALTQTTVQNTPQSTQQYVLSPTPTPKPTATPSPTPPPAETVLYQSDFQNHPDHWQTPDHWKVFEGKLITDGNADSPITVPFTPQTPNYSVRVDFQRSTGETGRCSHFYLMTRANGTKGYRGGYLCNASVLFLDGVPSSELISFDLSTGASCTLRLDVQGTDASLWLGNTRELATTQTQYTKPGSILLEDFSVAVIVTKVEVVAL